MLGCVKAYRTEEHLPSARRQVPRAGFLSFRGETFGLVTSRMTGVDRDHQARLSLKPTSLLPLLSGLVPRTPIMNTDRGGRAWEGTLPHSDKL